MPTAKTATIARRIVLTAIRQHQHDYCRIYYYLKLKRGLDTLFLKFSNIKKRSFGCGFYLQTVCVLDYHAIRLCSSAESTEDSEQCKEHRNR